MQRIKLLIEYDGSNFAGWQFQKGQLSVQEAIEKALFIVFRQPIRVTGAGRTDAGVHARNQVAHADAPEYDLLKLKRSLNGLLKPDIAIKNVQHCDDWFHARFDAISRRYRYYIALNPTALLRRQSWMVFYPLNLTLMQAGAERFNHVQNFQSFCKSESSEKHFRCTIHSSRWFFENELLVYEIQANRFVHGMVRAIVGTLVELGRGKITLGDLDRIIEGHDRVLVPYSAPAQGLVLEEVIYPGIE